MDIEDKHALADFAVAGHPLSGPFNSGRMHCKFCEFGERFGWAAAACSLLPELGPKLSVGQFAMLEAAFRYERDDEVCRLILEAVRKVKG